MPTWLDQIPLPLWATLAIAAILLAAAVFTLRRWFRLKAVKMNVAGTTLEFERKTETVSTPAAPATGLSQEVIAEKGGRIENTEQSAEGSNIHQKIHGTGQITGVKQNAKTR